MIYKLLALFLVAIAATPSYTQSQAGYELPPRPSYVILAPRKVRPGQVYQVSVCVLRLIYKQLTIRLSVKRGSYEFCFTSDTFQRPSTRIMQLQIPDTATPGDTYWLHVQGSVLTKGGLLFDNRTKLEYEGRKVSIFIQMSKPLYHQGQTVMFRVIPIKPNLLPDYGTISMISVVDATNTTVRRWHNIMTNAGGVIELTFKLAKQISEGKWKIQAKKDEYTHEKSFDVVEYWQRRFDVNVTMPRRLSEYGFGVYGLISANYTSGRPVKGNATVRIEIRDPKKTMADPPVHSLNRYIPVFDGKSDFLVTMDELRNAMTGKQLAYMEVYANVTVYDWFLLLENNGFGYSFIYPFKTIIKLLGGPVRPYKPEMPFTLLMVLYQPDGTQVKYTTNRFIDLKLYCDNNRNKETRAKINIPDNGMISYTLVPSRECSYYRVEAFYMEQQTILRRDGTPGQKTERIINQDEQRIFKYYSSSESYLQISTSTDTPKVNEYMIYNIRTSYYTPTIYYQIVAGGNIVFADKLDMPSNTLSKTFSVSISRDMAPIARIIAFYVKQNGEVVTDSLTFFANIERLNNVTLKFNRGKDFNVDLIEVNAFSEPGAYISFSAIHYDLFINGGSSILQDYDLTDELATYESHAQQPFNHTWYDDREVIRRVYFPTPSMGADTNSTFNTSGLILFTDANFTKANFYHDCNETLNPARAFPCYSYKGQLCYSRAQRCNSIKDCLTGYDEMGCNEDAVQPAPKPPLTVLQKMWRHFDDGAWMWKSLFIKPDGRHDFLVPLPKIDTSWVVGAFAVERTSGFSVMNRPAKLSGIRRFFITVEMPKEAVWGEQIGVRVAVFNYWNYWLEALVEIKQSSEFDVVWVQWRGTVSSYSPDIVRNKTVQTLVYLEAGESTYIYMPVIPRNKANTTIEICAYTFIGSNCERRSVSVRMNGVPNYYHTALMLDLTRSSSQYVTNFDIEVPEMFWEPEQRQLRYVPDSPEGTFAINGDVIGPALSRSYTHATTESVLRRPDDACENVLFEFGYNVELMLYLRSSNQFSDLTVRDNAFDYIFLLLQRLMSYFNKDAGAFAEFRENKNMTNPFLAAFGLYVFTEIEPIRQELNNIFYIPESVIRQLVSYLSTVQLPDGSFSYTGVRDRKFYVDYPGIKPKPSEELRRVPVTAMVVMALGNKDLPSSYNQGPIKEKAVNFLNTVYKKITDPFSMAIVTYALLSAQQTNTDPYKRMMKMSRTDGGQYWANSPIPRIGKRLNKAGQQIIKARLEWPNDAYSTQATAMALLAYYTYPGSKGSNVSTIVDWLQQMRNTDGGFSSTQDSFWAVKALRQVADADRDRSIYALNFILKLTSKSNFERTIHVRRESLATLHQTKIPGGFVWGEVFLKAEGTGRALLQLDVQKNVRENAQIRNPTKPFVSDAPPLVSFHASCLPNFSGRNASIMTLTACGAWMADEVGPSSGMAVFEIDLPTGYIVMNDDLRRYVEAQTVPNLRRAYFSNRKVHLYFDRMTKDQTCVTFRADRWYPVANMTENYKCSLYEYYEPGRHNTTKYEAQSLFNNNICNVCGSYQCPYCPYYNIASILKYSVKLLIICVFFSFYGRKVFLVFT